MEQAEETIPHRVTTMPSNGGMPESMEVAPDPPTIAEIMRLAQKELGDAIIDPEKAVENLHAIAEVYVLVVREQAAYAAKAEAAKVAKKSVESITNLLKEKIRTSIFSGMGLPLFDAEAREADLDAMVSAEEVAEATA